MRYQELVASIQSLQTSGDSGALGNIPIATHKEVMGALAGIGLELTRAVIDERDPNLKGPMQELEKKILGLAVSGDKKEALGIAKRVYRTFDRLYGPFESNPEIVESH